MCRLLVARFTGEKIESAGEVLNAFIESSKRDPYLERVSGNRYSAHDDGWGIAVVGYGDNPSIIYHRMIEPIYFENSLRVLDLINKRIQRYKEVYLLIHSRKSSRNEPYGLEYTHPFMRLMENGALWFAHNGGAKKEELARELGVYPWIRVDSELLGYYIMGNIGDCLSINDDLDECVRDAYVKGLKYIPENSGYNTGLLALTSRNTSLYISHKVAGNPSQALLDYYKIVVYTSDEAVIAGSITIKEYLPSKVSEQFKTWFLEPGLYSIRGKEILLITKL
ncbi:class II glutamine amidotransferase [Desulfurococcus amylolyticus]|uniref:Glutamine amidotransferase-like protein n=1 Tax=Desulfurococcus amylolyticus DSM 16532 TaxID=768672 RepID=I3XSU0_DESAM|nr:class II glutamine amidotransferase [Desulfurococcus amylolyticus]AFL67014.1 glutamine amidotransferase-like protein [Desulfurococcus amylolyticus DSM 16532]